MQLNPTQEYKKISEWVSTLIGKKIKPRCFARRLETHLNQRHPIRVRIQENTDILDPDDFTIGAEYDCELDQANKKHFIVNLIINHPKHVPMEITGDFADRFTLEMVEALVHEYQHQHQYRSRGYMLNRDYTSAHKDRKIKEEQEYLGSPDEIDAYAANIAARFYLAKLLNTSVESLDLKQYYTVFGPFHPVVKRLLKKIVINTNFIKDNEHVKKYRRTSKRPRVRRL